MRDDYQPLAGVYDLMARDPALQAFYREWRQSLLEAATARGMRPRVLVDLACGTGNTTVPWARRRGWTVAGVDRSPAMLRIARAKSKTVRWYCQDLTALRIAERADLVTCHFDALNHVLTVPDLQRVFANVAAILRDGGLFQFDLNTDHMLRWLSTSEKLFRVGRHVFMAYNRYDTQTGVATFHQLWFVRSGRLYRKIEVSVRERAFSDGDVRRLLRAAGLRLVSVTPQRSMGKVPIRKVYLAERAGGPAASPSGRTTAP